MSMSKLLVLEPGSVFAKKLCDILGLTATDRVKAIDFHFQVDSPPTATITRLVNDVEVEQLISLVGESLERKEL